MEKELNIADILKDKPNGTKLYADAFGELSLECVNLSRDNSIYVKTKTFNCCSFYSDVKYTKEGEPILVPSKEMRDWSKFAWKKGDVLVGCAKKIIFDKFTDDTYSYFEGKYCLEQDPYSDYETYRSEDKGLLTKYFHIPERCIAQSYIKNIEERLGGKLNRETLEIEKQQEFKDGDILYAEKDESHTDAIFILETIKGKIGHYACLILHPYMVCKYSCGGIGNKILRYATEEEKQQLFEALAKEGKVWDSKKKQIVDLKPKWAPKPFDKVVTRVDDDAIWTANIFSHIDSYGEYNTIGCVGGYPYCLPYNEETAKLIGTTKEWKE